MSSPLLAAPSSSPRLLDQVRERIRVKHYSLRTEQAYLGWIKRYIFFHDKRHPRDMGKAEVEAFLGALAVERNVSAAIIWMNGGSSGRSRRRARGGESARCGVVSVSWDVRVGE
ncbi:MAG: phage integrase N-terminal SAM-like domain-containing protein [Proteobacteria bacterium]|nr:phage integrase N-terminal SAM-like domain-containing protein [Pseudomonadota bacterium]